MKKLKELWDRTTLKTTKNCEWEDLSIDTGGWIYVPQGSKFGDTLIMLDDDYENSGDDCLFISELIKEFKKEVEDG